jgi:deoxyhypusine synthase
MTFLQHGEVDADGQPPSTATAAVLVRSGAVPIDARKVEGLEFDVEHDMTVAEMVDGMSGMGFQASAIADAARIINEMVRSHAHHLAGSQF